MKIAIDLIFVPAQKTGVGQYAKLLIGSLAEFDEKNQYLLFIKKNQVLEFDPKKTNFRIITCSDVFRFKILMIFWEQFILPFILSWKKVDILHSLQQTTPLIGSFKRVVTFHDMTIFLFPEKHTTARKFLYSFLMPLSAKKADKLIADSLSTKNDMIKFLDIISEKINVVYLAANPVFGLRNTKNAGDVLERYGIKNKFILYVGTLEPRKNVIGLINAYQRLVVKNGIAHRLVIVGKKGWQFQPIFETVKKMRLDQNIIFTGYVPDDDLADIYNAADIFVYPSLYEGFGIPPLEAMACGVPTITSNVSSLPEVAGNACILINPNDTEEIEQSVFKLLMTEKLRQNMREMGLSRSKEFSRKKLADGTIATYNEVMN